MEYDSLLSPAHLSSHSHLIIFTGVLLILSIFSAIISKKRGRNPLSWFFITLVTNIFGVIIICLSKDIDKDNGEKDMLAKVLWGVVFVIGILTIYLIFNKLSSFG